MRCGMSLSRGSAKAGGRANPSRMAATATHAVRRAFTEYPLGHRYPSRGPEFAIIHSNHGVVPEAALDTVTVTGPEVVRLPSASRATAVRVCEPLLAEAVFQATA